MKNYEIIFTPRAKRQLNDLFDYIANESGEVRASDFIEAILNDCLSLKMFPMRGTKRDDLRPGLRIKGYKRKATIAFSVDDKTMTVAIHGVFYGGQDVDWI